MAVDMFTDPPFSGGTRSPPSLPNACSPPLCHFALSAASCAPSWTLTVCAATSPPTRQSAPSARSRAARRWAYASVRLFCL